MPRKADVALTAHPSLPSYAGLIDELGIDPKAVLESFDALRAESEFEHWTPRGFYEAITGRADYTAWTRQDAAGLVRALEAGPSLLGTGELPQVAS